MSKETKTTRDIFGFPFGTFKDAEDLQRQMLNADNNTLFLIGERETKHTEGDSSVELVWAKVFRTKDGK